MDAMMRANQPGDASAALPAEAGHDQPDRGDDSAGRRVAVSVEPAARSSRAPARAGSTRATIVAMVAARRCRTTPASGPPRAAPPRKERNDRDARVGGEEQKQGPGGHRGPDRARGRSGRESDRGTAGPPPAAVPRRRRPPEADEENPGDGLHRWPNRSIISSPKKSPRRPSSADTVTCPNPQASVTRARARRGPALRPRQRRERHPVVGRERVEAADRDGRRARACRRARHS